MSNFTSDSQFVLLFPVISPIIIPTIPSLRKKRRGGGRPRRRTREQRIGVNIVLSLVELKGVRKSFYGVEVLHGVDFKLEPGTVHALMGENGAGKSTMMKIIAGIHLNDGGQVFIDGNEVTIDSPAKAQELGVAMIHQELSPVLEMSVAENIFLGREPSRSGFVDYRQLYKQTQELLDELKIPINPKVKMKSLRVADQQMVEIAKAISQNAHILIMDEPTSSITDREVESLFAMIRDMKARGVGMVYISHKMDEIFQIADEITVLRDGNLVNTWKVADVDYDTLIFNMVGRDLKEQFPKVTVPIGETVLKVDGLTRAGQFEDISFELHKGEILGFVGLMGAGRTELMQCIFGLHHCGRRRRNHASGAGRRHVPRCAAASVGSGRKRSDCAGSGKRCPGKRAGTIRQIPSPGQPGLLYDAGRKMGI